MIKLLLRVQYRLNTLTILAHPVGLVEDHCTRELSLFGPGSWLDGAA